MAPALSYAFGEPNIVSVFPGYLEFVRDVPGGPANLC